MDVMPTQFDPPSGTRDFLAAEVEKREWAYGVLRSVFASYGFEPLQTPAFERIDVLLGKYGEEADKLVFKILRRGEHEASGEADLALRYDMTVPLARVAAAYGSQLPTPYKRYAMGSVWRADRPGKGRFREFTQCDIDTLGSTSPLADAEILCAHHDALASLGVTNFTLLLNCRHVLLGLLEVFDVPEDLSDGVLISLDKLDKLSPIAVIDELIGRGLPDQSAKELVVAMTAPDATERIRTILKESEVGSTGLDEVDQVLRLVTAQVPADRIVFTPRMVRGLSYYTGPIWETEAAGVPGSLGSGGRYDNLIEQLGGPDVAATGTSIGVERALMSLPDAGAPRGRIDVAVPVLSEDLATQSFALASQARAAGMRASVYLGASGKLGRQLKWASDSGARLCLIYGNSEREAGTVTVRDMVSAEQTSVPIDGVASYLADLASTLHG
ncbi:MAG TPA: histidine--tRNA ligase [Streptosporangiaceae bacterium]|nr:histidine--tRNA ligase [Streptosporangiaceae bacterium]